MKRVDLLRYLNEQGCLMIREGKKHSVLINPNTERTSTVPRHNEVDSFLAKKICKDLGIKQLEKK
ncbi:MAG: type II toxin-antitoxin system HicA family toxin [Patescibacteria group bacterium]